MILDRSEDEERVDAPARAGYRWPAEWEEHTATWLCWPHNSETWPELLGRAEDAFAAMVAALWQREEVRINVGDAATEERARRCLEKVGVNPERGVAFFEIPTNDSWIRDHGPVFLTRPVESGESELALADFGFNAWGERYPPWDLDDAVPGEIASLCGYRRFRTPQILEAGSIDGDGEGTLLTTTSCLLNPNRGPEGRARSREEMESFLADWLGASQVLWLGEGIAGDDTDGHVDDVARFVSSGCVVAAVEDDPSDPNHAPLRDDLERLRQMTDAQGRRLDVVSLPMPPSIPSRGPRCPASYANFYLANGVALVPTFGVATDERALAILKECLPGREVVGIRSEHLIVGLGAVHCLTQQVPA